MFLKFLVIFWCVIGLIAANYEYVHYDERDGYAEVLSRGDSETREIPLETPINLFSEKYDHVHINTDGILTFTKNFDDYMIQPFPIEYPSIAPFYSNVDTTPANDSTRILFFKNQNPDVLHKSSSLIRNSFLEYSNFEAQVVYVASWENVGYFNSRTDKLNTFQAVIICTEVDTFVKFVYPENGIQWLRGELGELGLPDIRAQAGFNSEDGRFFKLENSGTEKIRFLSSSSNINTPGVWLYRVGFLDYSAEIEQPNNPAIRVTIQTPYNCRDGLWKECHSDATCIDTREGFCCKCNEGFYGNGRSCVNNSAPMRIVSSLSGTINGQQLSNNIKAQSYVSLDDGRSYTAINPVEDNFESLLRLALPISGAVGWVFAKPSDNSASYGNGYQLTGGKFNHLSSVRFPSTGDVLTINQTFEGLNDWDQLIVKVEVNGNVPKIDYNQKVTVEDFLETYTFRAANHIFSEGSGKLALDDGSSIEFNLEQTIKFDKCAYSDDQLSLQPTYVKVSKIFVEYFTGEKAVRTQYTAKISDSLDGSTHPCEDGSANCGYNTICQKRQNDEYYCLCKNGFELEQSNDSVQNCVDINECESGNICDANASCGNIEGGYECVCNAGYSGNGYQCYEENNEPRLPTVEIPLNPYQQVPTPDQEQPAYPPNYENSGYYPYPPQEPVYPEPSHDQETPHYHYPSEYNPYEENPCVHCSRDATCNNDRCECNVGFAGNGETCTIVCLDDEIYINEECVPLIVDGDCKGVEDDENDGLGRPNYDDNDEGNNERNEEENVTCTCPEGYKFEEDDDKCHFIRDNNYGCLSDDECHSNALCEWASGFNTNVCQCKPGFEGDADSCYQVEESCLTNSQICDPNALCMFDPSIGRSECHCKTGFEGDGLKCTQTNECKFDYDCGVNSNCDGGICLCNEGFERDSADFCVQTGKCGGAMCGENAICKTDPHERTQYCECLGGFSGDPLVHCKSTPPPCNLRNNCGLYAACAPSEREYGRYECVCHPGYHGDGYDCVEDITCRNTPSVCDPNAACLQSGQSFSCACNPGFIGNGTTCREIQSQEAGFFLLAQGPIITKVPFGREGKAKPILVSTLTIGLDKDCVEGRIYYGDILSHTIMSAKYDGSDARPFITEGINEVEGIAVDHISRRIYWTDSGKHTIEVASLENPSLRTVIVHKNLINPRGIAVDTVFSKIYWSDWGRASPKIEMANLDGTERITLLEKPDVILPNSLVVIPHTSELCYTDAGNSHISCIDVFTKAVKTIASDAKYPFGLAFTNNNFYWTDWTTKQIDVADSEGTRGQSLRIKFSISQKMYAIVAVTDECPIQRNACSINNGGCLDNKICLINPYAPSGMTCKCTQSSETCKPGTSSSEVLSNNNLY